MGQQGASALGVAAMHFRIQSEQNECEHSVIIGAVYQSLHIRHRRPVSRGSSCGREVDVQSDGSETSSIILLIFVLIVCMGGKDKCARRESERVVALAKNVTLTRER